MKKTVLLLSVPFFCLHLCGCVPLLIGAAAGGVGVYAVSQDTVQTDTDISFESLWNSAISVARIRGKVTQHDSLKGTLEFDENINHVWVRLIRVTRSTTRVRVSCRKHHLPNIALAQEIFVKVIEQAR